jgi:site-specific DNA-methyltransferase (adenine-specific)
MIFLLSKGIRYRLDPGPLPHGSVWRCRPKGYAGHPAAFPAALIEPIVRASSQFGDIILDPFGGSGTTAHVALNNDRRALLVELNPGYAALSRRRIAAARAECPLYP